MNLDFLKALLQSRKFWLALLGVIGGVVMYLQGTITPEQLVDLITTLVGVLVGSIALEDAAKHYGK